MKSLYDTKPLSENALQCLNEIAQINIDEPSSKTGFDANVYYIYVRGECGHKKFAHFHIKHKGNGWDIRMLPDGTFHSIKTRGKGMQNPEDAKPIEKIAKIWVTKQNFIEKDLTNGRLVTIHWTANNR